MAQPLGGVDGAFALADASGYIPHNSSRHAKISNVCSAAVILTGDLETLERAGVTCRTSREAVAC